MKLSGIKAGICVTLVGLCLASVERLAAQGAGSLKNLDLDKAEKTLAVDALITENQALKEKLTTVQAALSALQKNFGMVSSEAEVFRRKAAELNARLEALGTGKLDDRLLKLLNELKAAGEEKARIRDALIQLNEAVLSYEKKTASTNPSARLELEAAMRDSAGALGVAPNEAASPPPIPSTLTDGMVVSVKEDLALIVANIGIRHGVRLGMPFDVIRDQTVIGTVRIVDVRDKIAGALIQNLSDKETVKVGDRLKVVAQQ